MIGNIPVRDLAVNLRKVWQAHDERNESMGWRAATNYYGLMGADSENAAIAGFYLIHAFFLSDIAERHQNKDPKTEDKFYDKAKLLLTEARRVCDFETESPTYTIRWWKAYRHKDKRNLMNGLIKEHEVQFGNLDDDRRKKYADTCAKNIVSAAKEHKTRAWSKVDNKLVEYFKTYLEALEACKK